MIEPAQRLSLIQEYYFSKKLKEIARRKAAGEDIISLAIGSPDMPPSENTVETLCREARNDDGHGYMPTIGIPELRKAMAGWYDRWFGVQLDPDSEIQPLIGSKEGILHVSLAFANPGDKVLIPDPGYPTYTSLSKLLGLEVVKYNLTADSGWQPNFDELEQMDLSGVKILWSNYPGMPTGARAQRETLERLVDFGRRHDILIVNDNPYSFILNDERLSLLQVEGAKDCCIEFNSMSKSHNMPGWRVAMLAARSEYISYILKVKSNIDNGTFRAMQLAAAEALGNDEEWHRHYNMEVYSERRHVAEQIMLALGCTFDKRQVGMFLWGRIPEDCANVEQLTEKILNEAHVFITPGFIFGENGRRYIRISLCAKREQMELALERIKALNLQ